MAATPRSKLCRTKEGKPPPTRLSQWHKRLLKRWTSQRCCCRSRVWTPGHRLSALKAWTSPWACWTTSWVEWAVPQPSLSTTRAMRRTYVSPWIIPSTGMAQIHTRIRLESFRAQLRMHHTCTVVMQLEGRLLRSSRSSTNFTKPARSTSTPRSTSTTPKRRGRKAGSRACPRECQY